MPDAHNPVRRVYLRDNWIAHTDAHTDAHAHAHTVAAAEADADGIADAHVRALKNAVSVSRYSGVTGRSRRFMTVSAT